MKNKKKKKRKILLVNNYLKNKHENIMEDAKIKVVVRQSSGD